MKFRKITFPFLIFIAVIIVMAALPLAILYTYAASRPATYSTSYYAALPVKYDRLNSVKSGKIVVIGGSSVAFGIDSKLVEKELGMPCVNFGLYAAFGLKPMLDLSEDAIGKGDIVIIAPEFSSQMYSDYVGYDYLLQACEGRTDMALDLGISYAGGMISELSSYVEEAKKVRSLGGLKVSGVYALSSFDKYGDIVYERDVNVMDGMFSADNLPEINESLVTDAFVSLVNEYAKKAKAKGASVYFSFCPLNALSAESIPQEDIEAFLEKLEQELDVEIIGSLDDHMLDAGYFYDSNFHTNEAGTIFNTVLLINDLKRVAMDMTVTMTEIPEPPAVETEMVIASGVEGGFNYIITSSGVTITGLDDNAMKSEKLEIPSQIENYVVIKIDAQAFADCSAKEINLPDTITVLSAGIFNGAKSLEKVVISSRSLPEVGNGLMTGASDKVRLFVPSGLYSNYVTDYFWGAYAEYIDQY